MKACVAFNLSFIVLASSSSCCAAFVAQFGGGRRSAAATTTISQLSSQDQFMGLNDDGDFLLVGINGDDPLQTDSSGDMDKDSSSSSLPPTTPMLGGMMSAISSADASLDAAALARFSSSLGSATSGAMSDRPDTTGSTGNNDKSTTAQKNEERFPGLTDDGDFLMVGINGDPLQGTGEKDEESALPSPAFGLQLTSADDSIDMSAVARFKEQALPSRSTSTTSSGVSDRYDSLQADDESAIGAVEEWLLELIPTLPEADSFKYSRELVAIGFDPGCVTQCELTWEDLSFMKLLHRRYLFNEVTGQGHPWEA